MKPSIFIQTVKKSVASSLIAALVLTAPGLSPYQALANPGGGALRTSGTMGTGSLNIGKIGPGAIPGNLGGVSGKGDLAPIAGEDLLGFQSPGAALGIGDITQDIQLLNNGGVGSAQGTVFGPERVTYPTDRQVSDGRGVGQANHVGMPVNAGGERVSGVKADNETGPRTKAAAKTVGNIEKGMPTVTGSNPGANPAAVQQELDAAYYEAQGKTGTNATPVVGEAGVATVGMPGNNLLADAGSAAANKQEATIPGVEAKTSALVVQPQPQAQPNKDVFGLDSGSGAVMLGLALFGSLTVAAMAAWLPFRLAVQINRKPHPTEQGARWIVITLTALFSAGMTVLYSPSLVGTIVILGMGVPGLIALGILIGKYDKAIAQSSESSGRGGSITGMGLLALGALLGLSSPALAGQDPAFASIVPEFLRNRFSGEQILFGAMVFLGLPFVFVGLYFGVPAIVKFIRGLIKRINPGRMPPDKAGRVGLILSGIGVWFITSANFLHLVSKSELGSAHLVGALIVSTFALLGAPVSVIAYYAVHGLQQKARDFFLQHPKLRRAFKLLALAVWFALPFILSSVSGLPLDIMIHGMIIASIMGTIAAIFGSVIAGHDDKQFSRSSKSSVLRGLTLSGIAAGIYGASLLPAGVLTGIGLVAFLIALVAGSLYLQYVFLTPEDQRRVGEIYEGLLYWR